MKHLGDVVIVRCLASESEPETYLLGRISETLAAGRFHALHAVAPESFKWGLFQPWGAYDGVRFVLAREHLPGCRHGFGFRDTLEWLDTWPRRHGGGGVP